MRNGGFAARIAAVLLAALGAALSTSCASAATAAPAPNTSQTVIAIGDLHGDYDAYISLVRAAGLVDAKGRWIGGKSTLVQTGDVPDRGPETKRIITHLMKLEKEAARKGGAVVALIGNHEAMNATGDLRYVTAEEYAAFKTPQSKKVRDAYFKANKARLAAHYRESAPELSDEAVRAAFEAEAPLGFLEHRVAWGPKGQIGAWVGSHDAMRIVGDTLFVHGGVSDDYIPIPIAEINARVRAALKSGMGDILNDEKGPLWYRGNASQSLEGEAEVASALHAYGVRRIVIGHTPQRTGIKAFYGDRVIAIDTGIAKYYGGTRSFLRIDGEGVYAVDDGVETKIGGR